MSVLSDPGWPPGFLIRFLSKMLTFEGAQSFRLYDDDT